MEFLDPSSHRDLDGIGYYFGKDLERIKEVTLLQKSIRDELLEHVRPGISTFKLNNLALKLIKENNAEPLFLGYGGFPCAICTSVNHEVVHGIARKDKLKKGDVLSLDLGVKLNGYCGDSARTIVVGGVYKGKTDQLLIETAEKSFNKGLEKAFPGNTIGDIGHAILEEVLRPKDTKGHSLFDIYEKFTGHGIGHELHEKPHVFNYGKPGHNKTIKEGMCICIEPVIIHRGSKIVQTKDVFTFSTSDGKNAAHYENQVYISKEGPIILT